MALVQRQPALALLQVERRAGLGAQQQPALRRLVEGEDEQLVAGQRQRADRVPDDLEQASLAGGEDAPVAQLVDQPDLLVGAVVAAGEAVQPAIHVQAVQPARGAQPEPVAAVAQEGVGADVVQRLQPGGRDEPAVAMVEMDAAHRAQQQRIAIGGEAVDHRQAFAARHLVQPAVAADGHAEGTGRHHLALPRRHRPDVMRVAGRQVQRREVRDPVPEPVQPGGMAGQPEAAFAVLEQVPGRRRETAEVDLLDHLPAAQAQQALFHADPVVAVAVHEHGQHPLAQARIGMRNPGIVFAVVQAGAGGDPQPLADAQEMFGEALAEPGQQVAAGDAVAEPVEQVVGGEPQVPAEAGDGIDPGDGVAPPFLQGVVVAHDGVAVADQHQPLVDPEHAHAAAAEGGHGGEHAAVVYRDAELGADPHPAARIDLEPVDDVAAERGRVAAVEGGDARAVEAGEAGERAQPQIAFGILREFRAAGEGQAVADRPAIMGVLRERLVRIERVRRSGHAGQRQHKQERAPE